MRSASSWCAICEGDRGACRRFGAPRKVDLLGTPADQMLNRTHIAKRRSAAPAWGQRLPTSCGTSVPVSHGSDSDPSASTIAKVRELSWRSRNHEFRMIRHCFRFRSCQHSWLCGCSKTFCADGSSESVCEQVSSIYVHHDCTHNCTHD